MSQIFAQAHIHTRTHTRTHTHTHTHTHHTHTHSYTRTHTHSHTHTHTTHTHTRTLIHTQTHTLTHTHTCRMSSMMRLWLNTNVRCPFAARSSSSDSTKWDLQEASAALDSISARSCFCGTRGAGANTHTVWVTDCIVELDIRHWHPTTEGWPATS